MQDKVGLELGVDTEQQVVVMRVSAPNNEIHLALSPEQAYSVAVGLMGALRGLHPPSPQEEPLAKLDVKETVH